MAETDPRLLLLSPGDNVYVLRAAIEAGEEIAVEGARLRLPQRLGIGHKLARRAIPAGAKVVKYGAPIGSASADIAPGAHVHLHNLQSDYTATHSLEAARAAFESAQGERKA
jgi:hypothetical protein